MKVQHVQICYYNASGACHKTEYKLVLDASPVLNEISRQFGPTFYSQMTETPGLTIWHIIPKGWSKHNPNSRKDGVQIFVRPMELDLGVKMDDLQVGDSVRVTGVVTGVKSHGGVYIRFGGDEDLTNVQIELDSLSQIPLERASAEHPVQPQRAGLRDVSVLGVRLSCRE